MKKIASLLIPLLSVLLAYAQPLVYQWGGVTVASLNLEAGGMDLDSKGNVFYVGTYNGSTDLNPDPNLNLNSNAYSNAIFIQKLDSTGRLLWVKILDNTSSPVDFGYDITVDKDDNLLITGQFGGTMDFNPDSNASNLLTGIGDGDCFVLKLNNEGQFIWAKKSGGTSWDYGKSITTDENNNVYVTGSFSRVGYFGDSSNIPLYAAANDIFVQKYDVNGNFKWVKQIKGSSNEYSSSITLDQNKNILITGRFYRTVDFNPGPTVQNLTSNGGADIFVLKLDSSGNFVWVNSYGNSSVNDDKSYQVVTDNTNNIYITGEFASTVAFDATDSAFNITSTGFQDSYILKLNSAGKAQWVYQVGGTNHEIGHNIFIDSDNNIYASGNFNASVDFDNGIDTFELSALPNANAYYLLKLSSNGEFKWATKVQAGWTTSKGLKKRNNRIYLYGEFSNDIDLDPTPGTDIHSANSNHKLFYIGILDTNQVIGIIKHNKTELFNIYPNPAENFIKLNFSSEDAYKNLRILNINGAEVYFDEKPKGMQTIYTSNFTPGIYFIAVELEGSIYHKKVILK